MVTVGRLVVDSVETTEENEKIFKVFTNRVVGAAYTVPEHHLMFFGYRISNSDVKQLICVGSVRPARQSLPDASCSNSRHSDRGDETNPGFKACAEELANMNISNNATMEDDELLPIDCHVVNYLFTERIYRHEGIGSLLLRTMESQCRSLRGDVPIRLLAASKAKGFFLRQGYKLLPVEPIYRPLCRVHLFRKLFYMEKTFH